MSQLPEKNLEARKEVVIPVTLSGLLRGCEKIFHKAPREAFQYVTRKLDTFSNKGMTGPLSFIGMPLGIMLRNGARAGHHASKGRYAHVSEVAGVVGAGAAWYVAGSAIAAKLSTLAIAGTIGKIGTVIAAAVVTAPVTIPAFTAGVLLSATAIGLVTAGLSAVPAVVNLPVAIRRTVDRLKGLRYNEADLQQQLKEESLQTGYEREALRAVESNLQYVSEDKQRAIYARLKEKFDTAATPAAANAPATAAPRRGAVRVAVD